MALNRLEEILYERTQSCENTHHILSKSQISNHLNLVFKVQYIPGVIGHIQGVNQKPFISGGCLFGILIKCGGYFPMIVSFHIKSPPACARLRRVDAEENT